MYVCMYVCMCTVKGKAQGRELSSVVCMYACIGVVDKELKIGKTISLLYVCTHVCNVCMYVYGLRVSEKQLVTLPPTCL